MRVLILGGTGMLGHKVWQVFEPVFDTWMTTRMSVKQCMKHPFFNTSNIFGNIDVNNIDTVENIISAVQPHVIVNCIGIIKQVNVSPVKAITINALFPHRLLELSETHDIRLIHISTDCVFSGRKGKYEEIDLPDPCDLYGRTVTS